MVNDLFVIASSLDGGGKDVGGSGAGGGHGSRSCDTGEGAAREVEATACLAMGATALRSMMCMSMT